jgi:hypothetical protein
MRVFVARHDRVIERVDPVRDDVLGSSLISPATAPPASANPTAVRTVAVLSVTRNRASRPDRQFAGFICLSNIAMSSVAGGCSGHIAARVAEASDEREEAPVHRRS